jgi:uncharacterized protein YgiM (DUF1202 family)
MYEAQFLATVLFVITSILTSIFIIYRQKAFGYGAIISLIIFLCLFISWQRWAEEIRSGHAVITTTEVSALSGPSEDYKEILVLHDGAEIRIREVRGDYALIQLPSGLGGWIEKHNLEEIF